ncbi:repressor protein C [Microcystis phage vB_MweS-yong2]|nr:repressor protein C [Microcystis phage vB_MweS-yong2]
MTQNERLKKAREAAGYATAAEAAKALNASYSTYSAHENGEKGLSRSAERYARFFRVNLEWLLTGRGDMKPKGARLQLPMLGKVGAGAVVYLPDEPPADTLDEVALDIDGDFLLEVTGDSQWPRYMAGEVLIVAGEPSSPERLIGSYAVVQVESDGMRLLKQIRRGKRPGRYLLWSHNKEEMDDVVILAAWRVKGVWYG